MSAMKFLIINTDYPPFLMRHYAAAPALATADYATQMRARMASGFGVADSYTHALNELGHQAQDIHINNVFAQYAWAREHAPALVLDVALADPAAQKVPWNCGRKGNWSWLLDVLVEQVRQFAPDVVLNQAMDGLLPADYAELRPYARLLAGQHASPPLDWTLDYRVYDLCISSFPATVDRFRSLGLDAELHRLAFDGRILSKLADVERDLPLTFVGSFYDMHKSRTALLQRVAERFPLKIWGPMPRGGLGSSVLADCYQGEAWGLEMLTILRRSQITLNHHGNVPPFANNFRLYEATGTGALLITDWKQNLHEMFDPQREVVAYRDEAECLSLIERYMADAPARTQIAAAGQRRTLTEHTFMNRMQAFAASAASRLAGRRTVAA